jgi:Macrocin-O-methyltransferase (TylF)
MPMPNVSLSFKEVLTRVGRYLPIQNLTSSNAAVNYLTHGRWMHDRGYDVTHRLQTRQQVWTSVANRLTDKRVLYMEFGVAHGGSMAFWSNALKNSQSVLHGFDSFEGLPESAGPWVKGEFSVAGQIPAIPDPRVRFFKGWFDAVLPGYTVPAHDVLVLNLDADLYSSTIYVLRYMRPHIRKGSFLYFDEIHYADHEQRAFGEFLSETGLKFRCCGADKSLAHVFFECLG